MEIDYMENEQLFNRFDKGEAEEVLRGDGQYFVADVTFRDQHDLILVIGQLLLWASEGHLREAASAFEQAIRAYVSEERLSGALDLYMTYRIFADDGEELPLDDVGLRREIVGLMCKMANDVARDESLRALSVRFLRKHPELNERIGLE